MVACYGIAHNGTLNMAYTPELQVFRLKTVVSLATPQGLCLLTRSQRITLGGNKATMSEHKNHTRKAAIFLRAHSRDVQLRDTCITAERFGFFFARKQT